MSRQTGGSQLAFDLAGRTALVTGASSGLGRRFAAQLVGAGAKVAAGARRAELLQDLAREVGEAVLPVGLDVTDEASVVAGFDAAEARLGPIDTVVANAGINLEGLATDIDAEDFDRVFAVNVRGAFLTAREGARRMIANGAKQSGRGRVVLIASVAGSHPLPGLTAYCASKAAVLMMGKTLAREWANRGINVNVICPGYIETEINRDWFAQEGGQRQLAGFPRRRLMTPADLDAMLLYLCSDAARAVTGSVFTVDDGQML